METLFFVKFINSKNVIILKKNKMPITYVDKVLNPIYSQIEKHFNSVRYLKRFQGYIFKIGYIENSMRLHYIDTGGEKLSDQINLETYAKLLKIDPIKFLYKGLLTSSQKNEIISKYIDKKSSLAGVIGGKYYVFHRSERKSIPKDMSVLIVTDFIQFFEKNDITVKFQSDEPYFRYTEFINSYIYMYLVFNSKKYEDIIFDSPNFEINRDLINHSKLLDMFNKNPNYIIIYKIILGTFVKEVSSRGLYSDTDISNIKNTINKINLRLRGLDFINLMNQNIN